MQEHQRGLSQCPFCARCGYFERGGTLFDEIPPNTTSPLQSLEWVSLNFDYRADQVKSALDYFLPWCCHTTFLEFYWPTYRNCVERLPLLIFPLNPLQNFAHLKHLKIIDKTLEDSLAMSVKYIPLWNFSEITSFIKKSDMPKLERLTVVFARSALTVLEIWHQKMLAGANETHAGSRSLCRSFPGHETYKIYRNVRIQSQREDKNSPIRNKFVQLGRALKLYEK